MGTENSMTEQSGRIINSLLHDEALGEEKIYLKINIHIYAHIYAIFTVLTTQFYKNITLPGVNSLMSHSKPQ